MPGRTIRDAIALALETPGIDLSWVDLPKRSPEREAARSYLLSYVHDFAEARGVILEDEDIESVLAMVVAELREGRPLSAAGKETEKR